MGYLDGRNVSKAGMAFGAVTQTAVTQSAAGIDVSGEQAVSVPALMIDGLVIALLSVIAGVTYSLAARSTIGAPNMYLGIGLLAAVIFCGATRVVGTANPQTISRTSGRARLALIVWTLTLLFLATIAFALKIGTAFSRGATLTFFVGGLPLVVISRIFVPRLLARTLYAQSYRGTEVLIAGVRGDRAVAALSLQLQLQGCTAIHTIEFDSHCSAVEWPSERGRLLGWLVDTARVAGPGEIYVVSGDLSRERIASILAGLRLLPRAIYIVPPPSVSELLGLPIRKVGPTIAVESQREPMSSLSRAVKRMIDIVVAAFVLILVFPLFAVIGIAIKLNSPGPVFFCQRRNGYRGRQFRIWKFRTMTVLEDGDTVIQARREDQRITRIGRWLRKTSLDELPQLFNILKGEMSLVGPRPHAVVHDEIYAKLIENYEVRQHVKPGVTGWAQVNGLRGETPTVDLMLRRIEFDLWYAANASVALDIQILLRTVFAVLRQDNAY